MDELMLSGNGHFKDIETTHFVRFSAALTVTGTSAKIYLLLPHT